MQGEGGSCGVSASEYSCTHGAQINFGDLTPYLTYGVSDTIETTCCVAFADMFNVYTRGKRSSYKNMVPNGELNLAV
jgi:hypothetical protein